MNNEQIESSSTAPFISRRAALATIGAAGIMAPALAQPRRDGERPSRAAAQSESYASQAWDSQKGEYTLPPLPYAHDALEPHIDATTMRIHHEKHHAGYVNGANKALAELKKIRSGEGDASLIKHWERSLAFNASGHINHVIFWYVMCPPDQSGEPTGELERAIRRDFSSFDGFKKQFIEASNSVEGSGWGWLVYEPIARSLQIIQAEKHQNETVRGAVPLLGVDVWEHAYYLKYQNRRADYVRGFMNVVNWQAVGSLFDHAVNGVSAG